MLQVNFIRQFPEVVKERLAVRHFSNVGVVDQILSTDEELRKIKFATESIQAQINAASKEIGISYSGSPFCFMYSCRAE